MTEEADVRYCYKMYSQLGEIRSKPNYAEEIFSEIKRLRAKYGYNEPGRDNYHHQRIVKVWQLVRDQDPHEA